MGKEGKAADKSNSEEGWGRIKRKMVAQKRNGGLERSFTGGGAEERYLALGGI